MAPQHGHTAGLTRLYCYSILSGPGCTLRVVQEYARVCPCQNEHKTHLGDLARGKGTAHLHQTTIHYT